MGKSRSGATLHGCTRSEGELPDHATADGGPLSDRGAITQVPRQDAGFRGAELVAGYAGTLLSGGKHRFDRDFFTRAQDPADDTYQCTLRLLHYYAIAPEVLEKMEVVRGGAHTDFNCLTLLYQRAGQPGLQVCPGKAYDVPRWTPVDPREDLITRNIGDMLMRWSETTNSCQPSTGYASRLQASTSGRATAWPSSVRPTPMRSLPHAAKGIRRLRQAITSPNACVRIITTPAEIR
jgi:hypothetical protein